MAPRTDLEEFSDFEVVSSLESKPLKVSTAEQSTQEDIPLNAIVKTMFAEYQQDASASVEELHLLLRALNSKMAERNGTNDRRIRTLEYCFDDYESSITETASALNDVKKQISTEAQNQSAALGGLRQALGSTDLRSKDNATRLDRIVIKYLPSIESRLQIVQDSQIKQKENVERQLSTYKKELEGVNSSEIQDVRRIAAEANLRCHTLEQSLPAFKTDMFVALATEIDDLEASQKVASKELRDDLDLFTISQSNLEMQTRNLTEVVERTQGVVQHIAGKVAPGLQANAKEHHELTIANIADIKAIKEQASKREAILFDRVAELEKKVYDADLAATNQSMINSRLQYQINLMTDAIANLQDQFREESEAVSATTNDVPRYSVTPNEIYDDYASRQYGSEATLRAAVILRDLRAEIRKRHIRRQVKAIRAEFIRREIVAEFEKRAPQPRNFVTVEQLRRELFKRELKTAVLERWSAATPKIVISPPAVAPSKPPRVSSIIIHCKTLLGEKVTVQVPPFVSIRYLKQLIYFRTGCTMHPSNQSLVYAGRVLQDTYKIGGGLFTAPSINGTNGKDSEEENDFAGIQTNSTVLIVLKKCYSA